MCPVILSLPMPQFQHMKVLEDQQVAQALNPREALTWLWLWLWGSPEGVFGTVAAASTRLTSTFHAVGDGCWLL
jgi:hypothetical protein